MVYTYSFVTGFPSPLVPAVLGYTILKNEEVDPTESGGQQGKDFLSDSKVVIQTPGEGRTQRVTTGISQSRVFYGLGGGLF